MVVDFLLQELVEAFSGSTAGIVLLFGILAVAFAWWASMVIRRRLLIELQITREMIELQRWSAAAEVDLGLLPEAPLSRAQAWQHVAYGWPTSTRLAVLGAFGAMAAAGSAVVGASISSIIAGAVIGVISLAVFVVLAAVVFVLVSDLGEREDRESTSSKRETTR